MSIHHRTNIHIEGTGAKTMLLAHGFGCDQNMWRFIVPAFVNDFRVVLFDHMGSGKSDATQYGSEKYGALDGYVDDVLKLSMPSVAGRSSSSDTPLVRCSAFSRQSDSRSLSSG